MNLIEACKSKKPFKRKQDDHWLTNPALLTLDMYDITTDDWEVKEEEKEPREFWLNIYGDSNIFVYRTVKNAEDAKRNPFQNYHELKETIHLREVTDERT